MYEIPISNGKVLNLKTFAVRSRSLVDEFNYELNANLYTEHLDFAEKYFERLVPDVEQRAELQRFLGSCLLPHGFTRSAEFALLVGDGSNGKSTLVDILRKIFDQQFMYWDLQQITHTQAVSHVLACCEPVDDTNTSLLKSLIHNEKIVVTNNTESPITVEPKCRVIIECNKVPTFISQHAGLNRRKRVINFTNRVSDPDFGKQIDTDQVFTWIAYGARSLLTDRLVAALD
jgi:phage/plasmid-associated DNA primase